ncbi:phage antirepressor KilAC domain-containing protein [Clostridium sp. Sa3CUN1]|uniref:Phage antirepressor KilAC domain-containing protein n=1 Tax=Clostridium gallinarum TaxID=2762246 RepID=A0ABR8Q278_9CLOT|nr:phage antirepressor [Clostridium gallinarum]MBD7914517.1 phage antirepressor KilAC domain-containing protein [Clostridium gallinarum]
MIETRIIGGQKVPYLKGEVEIFKNEHFGEVRVISKENEPWFVVKDVCSILDLSNPTVAIQNLDSDEVTKLNLGGQIGETNLINESGLYTLIIRSRKEEAKKFRKWVTSEVLPSIRKHGMYAKDELLDNPDLLIAAATKLKEERAARLEAEKQRDKLLHQNKLYTTSEIAKELGLSSATKLNNLLSEKKIQYKQNGTWLLYSKYSEMELVSIKQHPLDNGKIIYDRKWTGKGRDFILNLF